jgi:hypothetical protein
MTESGRSTASSYWTINMAIFGILLICFAIVAGVSARQGLWSSAINVVNITMAGLIATNFFEPLARLIDSGGTNYMMDSIMLWSVFAFTFIIFRMITQSLSDHDVHFIKPIDIAGRAILGIWAGWVFVCFTAFAMVTAPIGSQPLGAWDSPEAKSFLVFSPERMWMAFAQSRSMGALSNTYSGSGDDLIPEDRETGSQVFDSKGEFSYKYYARRKKSD